MAKCNCEYCKSRRKKSPKIIFVRGFGQDCNDYEIKIKNPWAGFYAFCVTASVLIFLVAAYLILKNWGFLNV